MDEIYDNLDNYCYEEVRYFIIKYMLTLIKNAKFKITYMPNVCILNSILNKKIYIYMNVYNVREALMYAVEVLEFLSETFPEFDIIGLCPNTFLENLLYQEKK